MASYVMLGRFTDQGIASVRDWPARIAANTERARAAGIEIKAVYATMGEYDQVVLFEAPTEAVAMSALIGLGLQGMVRSTTMRAFSMEEMAGLLTAMS